MTEPAGRQPYANYAPHRTPWKGKSAPKTRCGWCTMLVIRVAATPSQIHQTVLLCPRCKVEELTAVFWDQRGHELTPTVRAWLSEAKPNRR